MKANQRFAACMLVVSCQLLVAKKIIYKTDVLSLIAGSSVLTLDSDFRIYRKNRTEAIGVIIPNDL